MNHPVRGDDSADIDEARDSTAVEPDAAIDGDTDPLEHAEKAVMSPAGPGTLAEQRALVDDDGDDIREYTGEPVETDEGWVVPQTQNTGPLPDDSGSR